MRSLILLLLIFETIKVNGQNHFLGVNGGTNWTDVYGSNFQNGTNFRNGLAIGLTYDYCFKKYFTVGTEILYNQRGFTFTDNLVKPEIIRFNSDYLTLPLKVGVNYGKKVFCFANIGLTPSILIGAKTTIPKIDFEGLTIQGYTTTLNNTVKKFDMGGLLEIGCGYKFKKQYWLFTSFSFQNSFTTITNVDYFLNSKLRHYGMTLKLGLKYGLSI